MKEQFCDYETSKMIKGLRFDEKCLAWYSDRADDKTKIISIDFELSIYFTEDDIHNSGVDEEVYCAPLWQQIENWLWDKHKIFIEVTHNHNDYKCECYIYQNEEWLSDVIGNREVESESPIIAKIKGIKKAVKYLHKQVETKV